MKVAVLNISIGDYICFWPEFYSSCQENFLVDCEKDFYVFTDAMHIEFEDCDNVNKLYQNDMGWPFNTMKRFDLFDGISDALQNYDYIFFANANAKFMYPLSSKLLIKGKDIVCVEHPGFHFCVNEKKPFERRKESRAYVSYEYGKYYVQGAFYGGNQNAFLNMIHELNLLTEDDLKRNIVAIWHDESFLNHFVSNHRNIQILGWQYLKYEEYFMPYEGVIVLRDKTKYLPANNARFKGRQKWYSPIMLSLRNMMWRMKYITGNLKMETIVDENGIYINNDIVDEDD